MINMPPRTKLTDNTGTPSCVTNGFCGYHNYFSVNGVNVKYAIVMDTSVDCAGGCGSSTDYLDNATNVGSHELIEIVTDPTFPRTFPVDYPAAWRRADGNEIGDLCGNQEGIMKARKPDGTHWVVQKEYDNVNGGCVAPCTPTSCASVGADCGTIDDQCGGTLNCGSCPGGASCGIPNPNRCCVPATTCGNSCGTISDGCGGTLDCSCPLGQACYNGTCGQAPPPPPPACVPAQCMQDCANCNGSAGHCVGGACVCSSKRSCI
jgi:hypothetical protein